MPIPGDNGNPEMERDKQNERICHVANTGAEVKADLKFMPMAPKEKNIFGEM
jgi:hypothetical protein